MTVNIDMLVVMTVVFAIVIFLMTEIVAAATARHPGYRPDCASNLSDKRKGGAHSGLLPIISW